MALPLMPICPVHPRCGNPDQHFSVAGSGHFSFIDPQHFRSAKSRQPYHSHASSIAAGNHDGMQGRRRHAGRRMTTSPATLHDGSQVV
jgi:hypothetical protein